MGLIQIPDSSEPTDFVDDLRECDQYFEHVTVPIYGLQDGQVIHDRSGVLYRIENSYFILTAAHGLREMLEHNIPLFLAGDPPVTLISSTFHSTEVEAGRDVAAITLSQEVAATLKSKRQFVQHNRIDMHDDGKGLYLIFGYPSAWSGFKPESGFGSSPLAYIAKRYAGKFDPSVAHDEKMHIALEFEQAAVVAGDGAEATIPAIHGVSGCGIWRVGDYTPEGLRRFRVENVRLVGIQHRWGKSGGYVRGSRIGYVLGRIVDADPSLGRAMSLIHRRSSEL